MKSALPGLTLQAKKLAEYDLINSILFAERALLYTLNFQIKVDLPMNQLWKTASQVGIFTFTRQGELRDGEVNESMLTKEQQRTLSQVANNFANDWCAACSGPCELHISAHSHAWHQHGCMPLSTMCTACIVPSI